MPRLEPATYLEFIRTESGRFREVLGEVDPAARVPTCPEWDASDLLWHLTGVQRFWTRAVRARPDKPEELEVPRPSSHPELLRSFDTVTGEFSEVLAGAGMAEPAWTWAAEQTVGFIQRRQAHEVLVHRLDAELTLGAVSPVDPQLAADGVEEVLDVMFGSVPEWGKFTPGEGLLRVDPDDARWPVWVQLGTFSGTDPEGRSFREPDIAVVDDPGVEPDAVLTGAAAAIDAWLWRRGDESELIVHGQRRIFDQFRSVIDHPIN